MQYTHEEIEYFFHSQKERINLEKKKEINNYYSGDNIF